MPNIKINTTVTCENTPIEDVLEAIKQAGFNDERDSLERVAALQAAIGGPGVTAKLMESEYQDKIDRLKLAVDVVKEDYDEAQKQLEKLRDERDSSLETSSLLRRKVEELKDIMSRHGVSRPALPEGMRIAEHPKYGRCVVSPKADSEGDFKIFFREPDEPTFVDYEYVSSSDLTFLDSEPVPSVLTTAEDFGNAPRGTVVASPDGGDVFLKVVDRSWVATGCTVKFDSVNLAEGNPGQSNTVLRWGWGEQQ